MKKTKTEICALCLFSLLASSMALASAKLSRDQLKHFDTAFAEQEKAQCLTQGPATRETWLLGEIKKAGEPEPKIQNLTREIWRGQVVEFKVDGEDSAAWWVQPSVGTFGVSGGKPFASGSKDGQSLAAEIINVGKGTLTELNGVKNLQNNFWLVEKSDVIPGVAILSLEAKERGAAGLIIFDGKKNPSLVEASPNSTLPLPVIGISPETARALKEKMKTKPVQGRLSLKTEYPVVEEGHSILVRKGARDQQTFIVINEEDCFALGKSLAFFQWINTGGVPVQGTTFVFFNQKSFLENKFVQDWGNPAVQLNMTEAGESNSDAMKFLNQWFKSDQNPDDVYDVKPILKKANNIQKDLKGIVSGEELKKYNDLLKQIEKPPKALAGRGPINYKLAQIIGPLDFSGTVSDLKFLKQAHAFAEKGQWDQAIAAIKHVADFQWADNVSPEAFMIYEKQKEASGVTTPNPAIWTESQKGRQNVDVLIELLEREIDRLDQQLSDNFFKLQKSIEEFQKI